jgi:putative photosynthetic complex assembly protein 2
MVDYGLPILYALFLWWFSTGVIIFLDRLPRWTFLYSIAGATIVLLCSLYGLWWSSTHTNVMDAYVGFSCALMVWGWHEISFLMGILTGPRRSACPEGVSGWHRFCCAAQTLLYHEIGILVTATLIVALTAHGQNQFGTWTFMILWWMRLSAKLNVFFGVRNLTEELLPSHLYYLSTYFKRKPINLFFPVSVTVSTIFAVWIAGNAEAGLSPFETVGYVFLTSLMCLAILEHWFLVLPLNSVRLWSWSFTTNGDELPCETSRRETASERPLWRSSF